MDMVIKKTFKFSRQKFQIFKFKFSALRPENYGESSLSKVIEKLNSTLRLDREQSEDEPMIRLIDKSYIKILSNRVKEIISVSIFKFSRAFFGGKFKFKFFYY